MRPVQLFKWLQRIHTQPALNRFNCAWGTGCVFFYSQNLSVQHRWAAVVSKEKIPEVVGRTSIMFISEQTFKLSFGALVPLQLELSTNVYISEEQ
jgi:hypothetical protein